MRTLSQLSLLALTVLFLSNCQNETTEHAYNYINWSDYLGSADRSHYSTLDQITPENIHQLQVAWTYAMPDSGQNQTNPIIIDNKLFGVTSKLEAFAIDATTGKELWRFGNPERIWHGTRRGVAYWSDGEDKRVMFSAGPYLFALNPENGQPITTFGKDGKINLHVGLPDKDQDKFVISSTPGAIFENLIIMPVRVDEGANAARGDIRAFDVRTGELVWTFHTIPYPNEPGFETWEDTTAYRKIGGANNWAGMTVDPKLGIVYAPTGSASPDFYGGNRLGANLYANCLLALDARTGERVWHYQLVHHDLWDRDFPAPPNLITVRRNGKKIDAVVQITKQGYVFIFDRKTGKLLFDVEEKRVPPSILIGEKAWETQPIPSKPRPFARLSSELTEADISPYAENRDELLEIFRKVEKRLYAPFTTEPTLLMPGLDGGGEWGGAAADPNDGIIYINSNEMAWLLQMEADTSAIYASQGQALYAQYCATCHQKDLSGNAASGYPTLVDISKKLNKVQINDLITNGKGMMTGFPQLKEEEKQSIIAFLFKEETESNEVAVAPRDLYRFKGYTKFLDSKGLPAIGPPWGTLNALDLNTGEYIWSIPFGETETLKAQGHPTTGTENYGGAVVTENGLLFIAATKDGYFRTFDKKTGKILWETKLPAPAFATPSTYQINGKQYVVVVCGGEKLGTPKGNLVVAFALE